MAETIVFNIASKVLGSLGSLAINEVGLGWGLDEELKTLEGTLSTIKEVLSYAEEKQGKNHVVKIWYERLQATFYEADNLLDEFQYEALRRQVQSMKLNHHHHSRSSIRIQKLQTFMAEAILFNLASKVVEKIGSLALREVGLAWGLEDELKTLEARVSMIKAVLVDADQKQQQQQQGNNNLVISLWLERLEAAFYEADNVLDEFHYEALRRKVQLMRIMNHRSIGIQKLIRKKLDMIVDDRTKFHPIVTKDQKQTGTDHKAASTSLSSNANESEFFGRDNDRARLLQLIMSPSVDHKNISVIPIVGIGGVGKTTLVKLLFNHETVVRHFDLRIWVTVAQDLNVKRVMQKIIQRITDSNSPCTGLNSSKIKKLIKEKLHEHDGIAKLSEIAKEIVKKCHGCPLAPKTLGNNLFMETDESKWLDLKEKELWELAQKKHDILGVLRSSYNSLPTDLKRCFIYCSIFPKSYEIEIDKLIQLWRAQGIIKLCVLNRELEDTCIYGKEGVTKSLFELENLRTILFPFQGVGAGDNQGFVNRCISKFKL
ncbi:unnamed protein product [Camellia sinensis]